MMIWQRWALTVLIFVLLSCLCHPSSAIPPRQTATLFDSLTRKGLTLIAPSECQNIGKTILIDYVIDHFAFDSPSFGNGSRQEILAQLASITTILEKSFNPLGVTIRVAGYRVLGQDTPMDPTYPQTNDGFFDGNGHFKVTDISSLQDIRSTIPYSTSSSVTILFTGAQIDNGGHYIQGVRGQSAVHDTLFSISYSLVVLPLITPSFLESLVAQVSCQGGSANGCPPQFEDLMLSDIIPESNDLNLFTAYLIISQMVFMSRPLPSSWHGPTIDPDQITSSAILLPTHTTQLPQEFCSYLNTNPYSAGLTYLDTIPADTLGLCNQGSEESDQTCTDMSLTCSYCHTLEDPIPACTSFSGCCSDQGLPLVKTCYTNAVDFPSQSPPDGICTVDGVCRPAPECAGDGEDPVPEYCDGITTIAPAACSASTRGMFCGDVAVSSEDPDTLFALNVCGVPPSTSSDGVDDDVEQCYPIYSTVVDAKCTGSNTAEVGPLTNQCSYITYTEEGTVASRVMVPSDLSSTPMCPQVTITSDMVSCAYDFTCYDTSQQHAVPCPELTCNSSNGICEYATINDTTPVQQYPSIVSSCVAEYGTSSTFPTDHFIDSHLLVPHTSAIEHCPAGTEEIRLDCSEPTRYKGCTTQGQCALVIPPATEDDTWVDCAIDELTSSMFKNRSCGNYAYERDTRCLCRSCDEEDMVIPDYFCFIKSSPPYSPDLRGYRNFGPHSPPIPCLSYMCVFSPAYSTNYDKTQCDVHPSYTLVNDASPGGVYREYDCFTFEAPTPQPLGSIQQCLDAEITPIDPPIPFPKPSRDHYYIEFDSICSYTGFDDPIPCQPGSTFPTCPEPICGFQNHVEMKSCDEHVMVDYDDQYGTTDIIQTFSRSIATSRCGDIDLTTTNHRFTCENHYDPGETTPNDVYYASCPIDGFRWACIFTPQGDTDEDGDDPIIILDCTEQDIISLDYIQCGVSYTMEIRLTYTDMINATDDVIHVFADESYAPEGLIKPIINGFTGMISCPEWHCEYRTPNPNGGMPSIAFANCYHESTTSLFHADAAHDLITNCSVQRQGQSPTFDYNRGVRCLAYDITNTLITTPANDALCIGFTPDIVTTKKPVLFYSYRCQAQTPCVGSSGDTRNCSQECTCNDTVLSPSDLQCGINLVFMGADAKPVGDITKHPFYPLIISHVVHTKNTHPWGTAPVCSPYTYDCRQKNKSECIYTLQGSTDQADWQPFTNDLCCSSDSPSTVYTNCAYPGQPSNTIGNQHRNTLWEYCNVDAEIECQCNLTCQYTTSVFDECASCMDLFNTNYNFQCHSSHKKRSTSATVLDKHSPATSAHCLSFLTSHQEQCVSDYVDIEFICYLNTDSDRTPVDCFDFDLVCPPDDEQYCGLAHITAYAIVSYVAPNGTAGQEELTELHKSPWLRNIIPQATAEYDAFVSTLSKERLLCYNESCGVERWCEQTPETGIFTRCETDIDFAYCEDACRYGYPLDLTGIRFEYKLWSPLKPTVSWTVRDHTSPDEGTAPHYVNEATVYNHYHAQYTTRDDEQPLQCSSAQHCEKYYTCYRTKLPPTAEHDNLPSKELCHLSPDSLYHVFSSSAPALPDDAPRMTCSSSCGTGVYALSTQCHVIVDSDDIIASTTTPCKLDSQLPFPTLRLPCVDYSSCPVEYRCGNQLSHGGGGDQEQDTSPFPRLLDPSTSSVSACGLTDYCPLTCSGFRPPRRNYISSIVQDCFDISRSVSITGSCWNDFRMIGFDPAPYCSTFDPCAATDEDTEDTTDTDDDGDGNSNPPPPSVPLNPSIVSYGTCVAPDPMQSSTPITTDGNCHQMGTIEDFYIARYDVQSQSYTRLDHTSSSPLTIYMGDVLRAHWTYTSTALGTRKVTLSSRSTVSNVVSTLTTALARLEMADILISPSLIIPGPASLQLSFADGQRLAFDITVISVCNADQHPAPLGCHHGGRCHPLTGKCETDPAMFEEIDATRPPDTPAFPMEKYACTSGFEGRHCRVYTPCQYDKDGQHLCHSNGIVRVNPFTAQCVALNMPPDVAPNFNGNTNRFPILPSPPPSVDSEPYHGCQCSGFYNPRDNCKTCLLDCANGVPNDDCTQCICPPGFAGLDCSCSSILLPLYFSAAPTKHPKLLTDYWFPSLAWDISNDLNIPWHKIRYHNSTTFRTRHREVDPLKDERGYPTLFQLYFTIEVCQGDLFPYRPVTPPNQQDTDEDDHDDGDQVTTSLMAAIPLRSTPLPQDLLEDLLELRKSWNAFQPGGANGSGDDDLSYIWHGDAAADAGGIQQPPEIPPELEHCEEHDDLCWDPWKIPTKRPHGLILLYVMLIVIFSALFVMVLGILFACSYKKKCLCFAYKQRRSEQNTSNATNDKDATGGRRSPGDASSDASSGHQYRRTQYSVTDKTRQRRAAATDLSRATQMMRRASARNSSDIQLTSPSGVTPSIVMGRGHSSFSPSGGPGGSMPPGDQSMIQPSSFPPHASEFGNSIPHVIEDDDDLDNPLRKGWQRCRGPNGKIYYLNTQTLQSQWERPGVYDPIPAQDDQYDYGFDDHPEHYSTGVYLAE